MLLFLCSWRCLWIWKQNINPKKSRSETKTSIEQINTTKQKSSIWWSKNEKTWKSCYLLVFSTVLMNLRAKHHSKTKIKKYKVDMRAKHPSNREIKQRRLVKYGGRRTKNRRKLVTFFVFFTMLMILRAKHHSKIEIKQIQSRSESKTFIQQRNTTKNISKIL